MIHSFENIHFQIRNYQMLKSLIMINLLGYKDETAFLFPKVYKHPGTHQLQELELLFRVKFRCWVYSVVENNF